MNSVAGKVIVDTCTLENFVVVDALGLSGQRLGARACWTETIRIEVARGVRAEPRLREVLDAGWLGDPLEIGASVRAIRRIDQIRRALGGSPAQPMRHLGEAEAIYFLEEREPGWMFLSDDRAAVA